MEKNRSPYNTTLNNDLVKRLKFLSVELNKRQNYLLEEAIEDLLKKYETPQDQSKKSWPGIAIFSMAFLSFAVTVDKPS